MTNDAEHNGAILSQLREALAGSSDTSLYDKDMTEEDPAERAAKEAAWRREYLANMRAGRYRLGALANSAYKAGGERGKLLYGTHKLYLDRRLALVRPDLWERVEDGELTIRAAAVEAGIIYKPPAEEARFEALVSAWAKANLEERLAFLFLVQDELDAAENGEYLNETTTRGRRRPYRLKDEAKKVPEVEALLESGMAANDLAKQLGVSYRTLCRWRFGHTKPSQAHKDKLAQLVAELEDEPRQAG